jgi:putative ATP-binding cassette transporter
MSLATQFAEARTSARRIWALSVPYFQSDEKWKARSLLAAIVVLNLASVFMLVQFNEWYKLFYDALETRNQPVFWQQLTRFTGIAFALIIIAVYKFYLTQLLQVRWRAWMTERYLGRWLGDQAFYRLELARYGGDAASSPDNPDQRIQEDLNLFTSETIGLSMGLLNAVVTLVSFVGILWGLSGAFSFAFNGQTYVIQGFMVWMAIVYCVVGSVITHYIGRRQIPLNFRQQRFEANFRHHMVRVREYSESIALDRGEAVERRQLDLRFSSVLANYLELLKAQKQLIWFTSFFGQAAVVFPFIVAAPRFFSGAIQLGELMQISSAFGRVQDSLSWLIDNYSSLAAWRATADRLTSFEAHLQAQGKPTALIVETDADSLRTDDLSLSLPDGSVLVAGARLAVQPGDTVLVSGPSGSGKSTLFRALAGIWPFATGRVHRPADAMFLPQRVYLPNGPLRDALAYPASPAAYSDAALDQALKDALLPHLAGRLDEERAWNQTLSGGEQQRMAIARALLRKPAWIFADEATSALDESAEASLYERLKEQVRTAGGALVSIAHRPSTARHHARHLALVPAPAGMTARYRIDDQPA